MVLNIITWVQYDYWAEINDIDRVIKKLDDKNHESNVLKVAIDNAWKDGEPYEDEYYLAVGYKVGTLHLTIN